MKNSIATLLNSYVFDNSEIIKENGGNAADYILADAEAMDQGWLWFLSEDEITEFENDSSRRDELISEIKDYVNANFDYNLKADDLLEKWIVVKMNNSDEDAIRVTRRSNFTKMNFCDAHGDYGVKVACYNAGCYTLDNSSSEAQSDCSLAITKKFNVCVSLEECAGKWTVQETDDDAEFSDELIAKIESFIKEWRTANETHTEVTGWTYHDSHNFRTVISKTDCGQPDCIELDEDEQIQLLLQMPETAPYMQGTNISEETENFIFSFDRWATNPWYCFVEKK